jgi:hypothetical protein
MHSQNQIVTCLLSLRYAIALFAKATAVGDNPILLE